MTRPPSVQTLPHMEQQNRVHDISAAAALRRRADDCRSAVSQLDLVREAPLAVELLIMALELDAQVQARIRSAQHAGT